MRDTDYIKIYAHTGGKTDFTVTVESEASALMHIADLRRKGYDVDAYEVRHLQESDLHRMFREELTEEEQIVVEKLQAGTMHEVGEDEGPCGKDQVTIEVEGDLRGWRRMQD